MKIEQLSLLQTQVLMEVLFQQCKIIFVLQTFHKQLIIVIMTLSKLVMQSGALLEICAI